MANPSNDPVRDKYCHAVSWDYTTRTPEVERLRRMLADEYDHGGRSNRTELRIPADPRHPERFTMLLRDIARRTLDGMEKAHLTASADGLYRIMFPFPDRPCLGDAILLEAVIGALGTNDPGGEPVENAR
ncbi:hypothetical protein [Bifidobacterium sp. SO1]|uniref:hypothetical protein n=1 Tax=Bifidobacterium sp. SO1 TaxID=2809029 RepID=UPI001BDCF1C4|nr:hypothetical protein [Bifidobacterium sp. SO1]MBT1162800.1 hypothetical protein [Bifidobacterium sp. SO1]